MKFSITSMTGAKIHPIPINLLPETTLFIMENFKNVEMNLSDKHNLLKKFITERNNEDFNFEFNNFKNFFKSIMSLSEGGDCKGVDFELLTEIIKIPSDGISETNIEKTLSNLEKEMDLNGIVVNKNKLLGDRPKLTPSTSPDEDPKKKKKNKLTMI